MMYSEPIEALFDRPPLLEKRPGCPNGFVWRQRTYRILDMLSEWHDYTPRGKTHAQQIREHGRYWVKAAQEGRGSWGVGRDYYRVKTDSGQTFDIDYDRKPKGPDIKGGWFLWREAPEDAAPG